MAYNNKGIFAQLAYAVLAHIKEKIPALFTSIDKYNHFRISIYYHIFIIVLKLIYPEQERALSELPRLFL